MFGKRKTKLFFAPHQDDELLTLGIGICTAVLNGDDVHVILCTDGSKSNMRKVIANGKACSKHEGLHTYDLTIEEFIQARDREFTDSCLALGVKPDHIHIPEDRDIDGFLSLEHAQMLIQHYLSLLGEDALVCTHSPLSSPNQHRDHRTLGQAADQLLEKGIIRKATFFIEPYLADYTAENPHVLPAPLTITEATGQVRLQLEQAIASYSRWDPENGRYAVGYHSVSTEFNDFLSKPLARSYPKAAGFAAIVRSRLFR